MPSILFARCVTAYCKLFKLAFGCLLARTGDNLEVGDGVELLGHCIQINEFFILLYFSDQLPYSMDSCIFVSSAKLVLRRRLQALQERKFLLKRLLPETSRTFSTLKSLLSSNPPYPVCIQNQNNSIYL